MAGNFRNHMFSKYDLTHVKLMAVGGDSGSWVGSSFDLCGVNMIEWVLDPFHVGNDGCQQKLHNNRDFLFRGVRINVQ